MHFDSFLLEFLNSVQSFDSNGTQICQTYILRACTSGFVLHSTKEDR
jgi:hypothetical protein